MGLPDPRDHSSLPVLKRVQAGICRVRLLRGTPSCIRLPITSPVLDQMHRALDRSAHPKKVVLWAISCTALFGFFRLGELLPETAKSFRPATDLAWGGIAVNNTANPQMVCVHLIKSECDQFGKGSDIILGRTGSLLCPVAALLGFMAMRGDGPRPFFLDLEHGPITKAWFTSEVRQIINS